MIAALTTLGDAAQTAGVVVAALLAAATLLVGSPRARAAAMLGALVLTPVLLVANIWSTPQLEPLRERPVLALAAGAGGLLALAVGALLIHRRPQLLALAAAGALPFRVPIESGGDTANLLVPLYLVIAAGVLAYALPRLRAPRGLEDLERGDAREVEHARGPLEWLLAGAIVLYAAQATYSGDFDRALAQTIFFYVPFALLYTLLVRIRWTAQLAGRCLIVLLVLAVAFVGIGFVEYAKRELLLNPKVISSNQFESYFRVNSLFFDPNIYGRFLVTVMLGVVAVLLWSRRQALVAGCAVALVLLWAGLVLTLSQSSFTALLVGLTVLGALRWARAGRRPSSAPSPRRAWSSCWRRLARSASRARPTTCPAGAGRSCAAASSWRPSDRSRAGGRRRFAASTASASRPPASAPRRPRTRSRSPSRPSRASGASRSTSRSSVWRS